jgi:nitrate reductase gamma subunit
MNSPTTQSLLLIGLPYASIVVFIAGLIWRYRARMTISSLSSQMLESRWLAWGAVPFHLGMITLAVGHIIPLVAPGWWQSVVSHPTALVTVETIGAGAAMLALAGLGILFVRRLVSPVLRPATTAVDLIVLGMLILQIGLGLGVATMHRWGSVWSIRTTTPYLWSLLTLRPDPAFVSGFPLLITLHLAGAWIVLALIPFTRLVHMFSVPVGYLARPPQKVVWMTGRR